MIYRKAPPSPPRLLLRIVATAGAGALLGLGACSGHKGEGLIPEPEEPYVVDAADEPTGFGDDAMVVGFTAPPPNDADIVPCDARPCGRVADASDDGPIVVITGIMGIMPRPDAGDAEAPDDAMPRDAGDAAPDDASGPCHPVCGIIVRPDE